MKTTKKTVPKPTKKSTQKPATTRATAQLRSDLRQAAGLDPPLQRIIDALGYPPARARPPGFATLLRTIVSQQLSTTVASAIWTRLEKACNGQITARKIRNRSVETLRGCGLSGQKIGYAHGLAADVLARRLNLDNLANLDDAEVVAELVKVRGIGQWSAEIYAMFALGRGDIFPSGDLALQVAVQRYAQLDARPDPKTTADFAAKWSPYRSAVAVLMWQYYGSTTLE